MRARVIATRHSSVPLPGGVRPRSRVGEHGARLVHLADLEQRIAQLRERREAGLAIRGGKRGGAAEQVYRGRHVSALERPLTGRGEMVAGPARQLELRLADRTQLGSVAKRLLEVVADDLRVLGDSAARRVADPRGEALVKLRADPLRGRPVGGLLDQDVTEAEALATSR